MNIIKSTNLILRFALELTALVSLGYWGFVAAENGLLKVLLGIGLPLIAAVIWGLFVSPKAKRRLPEIGRLVIEVGLFGSAVLVLFATNLPTAATILAVLVVIHLPLTFLFKQRHQ